MQSRSTYWITAGGLLGLGALLGWAGSGHAATPAPAAFVAAACDLPDVPPALGPLLRCGTVGVPRDYADPQGAQIRLAVVVVGNAPGAALPDPVVYISGGPGSPLTRYAAAQAAHPYASGRNLVLVDQRGVGRSEPQICPGQRAAMLATTVAIMADPAPETLAARRAVFLACRDAAVASGIDLDTFGTTVTAADFEQVREALGIARWNVYGNSYGTTVAMTLAARYPATVRSLVLDSIYPPEPAPPWSAIVGRARAAFFASCDQDPACRASYPDLAGLYQGALDRLRADPLPIALPAPMHRPGEIGRLTAPLFTGLVANLLYYPPGYPALPRLIAAVHAGRTEEAARAIAIIWAGAESEGVDAHAAVECRDRAHNREPPSSVAAPLDLMNLYGVCPAWSALGPAPLVPVGTAIPTLVLSGAFDPVSGPVLSRAVAGSIGAQWVLFPLMGHHVRAFSPCAEGIVAAFIADPDAALDTTCASRVAPVRFLPESPTAPP